MNEDKRYTEGIAGDGAAILDNGKQITITEILNRLNNIDKQDKNIAVLHDTVIKCCENPKHKTELNEFYENWVVCRNCNKEIKAD